MVTFDTTRSNGSPRDWNFDINTEPAAGQDDFYSLALHELAHVLGFGLCNSWKTRVDEQLHRFAGPAAMACSDGPLNLDAEVGAPDVHWKLDTTSTVYPNGLSQTALMVPVSGGRRQLTDLDVASLVDIGWELRPAVDTIVPGDANVDGSFDHLDLIQVLQAGKYLSGEPATWGEGDWDGGPGGYPGEPPEGDGVFDQEDIVVALQAGAYLSGPYAAILRGGLRGDEQTSIIYDTRTGEIAVESPASREVTVINVDSAASIFTGLPEPSDWTWWDSSPDNNLFLNTHDGFRYHSFGNAAQPGLREDFIANDLTVVGGLAGGGGLGTVDLIFIPEPSSLLLALVAIIALLHWRR
jgi:hypothetical protein